MANDSTSIPKSAFAPLKLKDGDRVEGEAKEDRVVIRVHRRRGKPRPRMTGEQFVVKWRGKFPDIAEGEDPRLDALLEKHVKRT